MVRFFRSLARVKEYVEKKERKAQRKAKRKELGVFFFLV